MDDLDYWERLAKLNISSLQRRREKLMIVSVWKIKNGMIPNDIELQFGLGRDNLKYGSNSKAFLRPLPKTRGKALSSFEDSFMVRASKLWNSLPPTLREIQTLTLFTNTLDTYLSLIPDKPPVHGYYHSTDNSILSYKNIKFDSVLKL